MKASSPRPTQCVFHSTGFLNCLVYFSGSICTWPSTLRKHFRSCKRHPDHDKASPEAFITTGTPSSFEREQVQAPTDRIIGLEEEPERRASISSSNDLETASVASVDSVATSADTSYMPTDMYQL